MLLNIVYGIAVMSLCLFLEAALLLMTLRYYVRREAHLHTPSFASTFWVIAGVMSILVLGILAQVGIWAVLFRMLGEFPDFASAYYHSAVNLATLGYGDIVMSEKNRLLGPLEAINGVLMIGVSTAVLMAAFQDALKKTVQARKARGGVGDA